MNNSPNINHLWADVMVEEFIRNGVDHFCISSGSRSAPLALAVARNLKAKSFIHFDERGNGFRALGITSATGCPCAVITTSGTAAANLFPAIVEASKKKLPMVVLTADRPPELRFTGAHQTIDQVKMFGEYVRWQFDMPCPTTDIPLEFVLTTMDQAAFRSVSNPAGPVHINCMYREPLAPVKTRSNWASYIESVKEWQRAVNAYTKYVMPKPALTQSDIDDTASKIKKIKSGIIAVGKLHNPREQNAVLKLAEKLQWPVFADISSGLRLGLHHKNVIHYFDQILISKRFQESFRPDGVIHLGGRMTSKRWYEYMQAACPGQYIMALNHPLRHDPLHHVTTRIHSDIAGFCRSLENKIPQRRANRSLLRLQRLNTRVHHEINAFLKEKDDLSEPQTARLITELIPKGDGLFLANSMPIRDTDMFGTPYGNAAILGSNRGASGIDGTIATAAGFACGLERRVTLLTGDLAFLHDLNSMAMLGGLKDPMVIVVLNNNGGGIFSFLPIGQYQADFERYFGTPHNLTFSAVADLFGLNYARPETPLEFAKIYTVALKSRTTTIIEIMTHRGYNLKAHNELQHQIENAINGDHNK
ncbi:MAG: 2-succinyl-5-enolpyruvyl-6-hydroxy-3-cyclohexene-1-carboxylic-acid synthase [Candidatus Omnitrophica bacterium]|nr:2-succinyl-5-enolpyruvyl-6-hydroxy-3-cyclohexene-1-carboxylic-acid synthase [Candidatus Omnitrophota bacterium]